MTLKEKETHRQKMYHDMRARNGQSYHPEFSLKEGDYIDARNRVPKKNNDLLAIYQGEVLR